MVDSKIHGAMAFQRFKKILVSIDGYSDDTVIQIDIVIGTLAVLTTVVITNLSVLDAHCSYACIFKNSSCSKCWSNNE